MAKLGDMLKAAREEQGLTLEDVEGALRIRYYLLEALEESDFNVFPSPVVARGLIRNYAKYLALDPIEALTLYDGNGIVPVKGQRLTPNGIEFMNLSMAPRYFITWDLIIGILLFCLVVGGAGYIAYGSTFQPNLFSAPVASATPQGVVANPALALPTVTPLPTNTPTPLPPTPTPTVVVYAGVTVELLIRQPSWIQILVDDVKSFEGILQPGESREWTGQQRIAIRAGNAGGVEVVVNGTNRGFMGAEGRVADQVWEKVADPAVLTPPADEGTAPEITPTETPALDVNNEEQAPTPLEAVPEAEPASTNQ